MAKKPEEKSITPVMEEEAVNATVLPDEATEDVAQAEVKKPERVRYMLPRHVLTDDTHKTVIANGVVYQVKCGEWVEVPPIVARILDDAIYFKQKAEEAQEAAQKAGEKELYNL